MPDDDERKGAPEETSPQHRDAIQTDEVDAEANERFIQRRRFLQAGIGVTVAVTVTGLSALTVTGSLKPIAKITPQQEPPADGDVLVHAEDQSKPVQLSEIQPNAKQLLCYPKDPKTGIVKSGTDNNLIMLSRFDPSQLGPDTAPHAARGVVGYSGVCTHLCCTVSDWDSKNGWLLCPCHHSQFDPREDGKVMAGPAPRPLPLIPLTVANGQLTVAGGFMTSVGCS
ncbi:MAG TPA: ubiquinol-cytochrome c reductase iron-sulfur subunit [Trueperaceae bacterium]|nr:ubiquinol-cytochrome c reductase iron-sulfur subunit [Trueperaceae bacterium]